MAVWFLISRAREPRPGKGQETQSSWLPTPGSRATRIAWAGGGGGSSCQREGKAWHHMVTWIYLGIPMWPNLRILETEDRKKKNKFISPIIGSDYWANIKLILIKYCLKKKKFSLSVPVTLSLTIKMGLCSPSYWHFHLKQGCPTGFQDKRCIHGPDHSKPAAAHQSEGICMSSTSSQQS